MAREWLARQFRKTGNPQDALSGGLSVGVLKHRGIDITPFPIQVQPSEGSKPESAPFTDEQITLLEKEGLLTDYTNTGQTLASLRAEDDILWSTWHEDYPEFEALPSRMSAIAFNPENPFLPGSSNKTLEEQLEIVAEFNRKLQQRVPGVMAILGEASDYAELAFTYLERTGKYLFGEEEGYGYHATRTQTRVGGNTAVFGLYVYWYGVGMGRHLYVERESPGHRDSNLSAAPLVVPIASSQIQAKAA